MTWTYITVFLISGFRLYLAMGLDLIYDMNRESRFFVMFTGSIFGLALCVLLGDRLKKWWVRRKKFTCTEIRKIPLVLRILHRYGLWGLAGGTLFLGTIPSVTIALLAGYSSRSIFFFLAGGKLAWILFYLFVSDSFIRT